MSAQKLTEEEICTILEKENSAMYDELMWYRIFDYMREQHCTYPEYTPVKLLNMFYDSEITGIMNEDDYNEEDEDEDSI
jgi:hypothetical protein